MKRERERGCEEPSPSPSSLFLSTLIKVNSRTSESQKLLAYSKKARLSLFLSILRDNKKELDTRGWDTLVHVYLL